MRRVLVIFTGFMMILGGSVWCFREAYGTSIAGTAEDIAVNYVAVKINQSLKKGIEGYGNREDSGESLLHIERDAKGNIKYIEPDTMVINRLVLDFSTGVKENYSLDDTNVTKVNLGVVTGSKFLSQLPFYVKIKVQPLSLTKFQCETGFETQGINQTRYYVYCTVESKVRILAPFTNKTSLISRKYQLAEAVVVGEVPGSYVVVPKESILDAAEF